MVYLRLPFDHQCQCRRLNTANRQHLPAFSLPARVPNCICARSVHAEQPIADGTHQTRLIQVLVLRLVLQLQKTFANRLFGQRVDPQPLDGTLATRLLIHPTLYQLSFLPGIAAVNYLVGLVYQTLDDIELFVNALVAGHLDGESGRNLR